MGYISIGYLLGSSDGLNITYNIADLINKENAFGLAIGVQAVSDSSKSFRNTYKQN